MGAGWRDSAVLSGNLGPSSPLSVINADNMFSFGKEQPAQNENTGDMQAYRCDPDGRTVRRCDGHQCNGQQKAEQECSQAQLP